MKNVFLMGLVMAVCFITSAQKSQAQTGPVTILLQQEIGFDATVYKRMWYGLDRYATWVASQPSLPLCSPFENFRGRIDNFSLWTPYRLPHVSSIPGAPNYQTLMDSPSFYFSLPFQPGLLGDCYLPENAALFERDKMEIFYNQYR